MSAAAEQDQVGGFKKYLRVLARDKGYYLDIFKQMQSRSHPVRTGAGETGGEMWGAVGLSQADPHSCRTLPALAEHGHDESLH